MTRKDDQIRKLQDKVDAMQKGLMAVDDLINSSTFVGGLHLNGDPAPWDELRRGGRFEHWLYDFDDAIDLVTGRKKESE